MACRVTASVIADNTVLTFFHGLQGVWALTLFTSGAAKANACIAV